MLQLAFFILFFQAVFAVDSCPSKRTTSCASVSKSFTCADYYEFSWNSTTLAPLAQPKLCYAPSTGTKCATRATTYCEPPCTLNNIKVGAPSTFETCTSAYYSTGLCESIYVYEVAPYQSVAGDRWCYKKKSHDIFISRDGWVCLSTSWTCHD